MPTKFLYLVLDGLILLFPLLWSFEKRIKYFDKWKYLFFSIFLVMFLFIPWDILFTSRGVWGFNPKYLLGIGLFGLPLEEWLFFVVVPFSCVFIYESLKELWGLDLAPAFSKWVGIGIILLSMSAAIIFFDRQYSFLTFFLVGTFVTLGQFVFKFEFFGRLYLAYVFVLIPFFIFNGVLTGFGLEEEVVWYNNQENMGFRIATIPIEDISYGFLLIGLVTTLYLRMQNRTA